VAALQSLELLSFSIPLFMASKEYNIEGNVIVRNMVAVNKWLKYFLGGHKGYFDWVFLVSLCLSTQKKNVYQ